MAASRSVLLKPAGGSTGSYLLSPWGPRPAMGIWHLTEAEPHGQVRAGSPSPHRGPSVVAFPQCMQLPPSPHSRPLPG